MAERVLSMVGSAGLAVGLFGVALLGVTPSASADSFGTTVSVTTRGGDGANSCSFNQAKSPVGFASVSGSVNGQATGCFFSGSGSGTSNGSANLANGTYNLSGNASGVSLSGFNVLTSGSMEMGDTVTIKIPGGTLGVTTGTATFGINYSLSGSGAGHFSTGLELQDFVGGLADPNNVSGSGGALNLYGAINDPLGFYSTIPANNTLILDSTSAVSQSGTLSITFPFVDGVPYLLGVAANCDATAGTSPAPPLVTASAQFTCDPGLFLQLPAGDTFTSASGVFLSQPLVATPEPSSLYLLALGLIPMGGELRRRLALGKR